MGRRPLLERYPRLRARVSHRVLGPMDSPVARLGRLSGHVGAEIWVKRDDLCAAPYGGNKTRKLEFLLADALDAGARSVITFGYVGSNHCLATTVHARRLGLAASSQLLHLPGWAGTTRHGDRSRLDPRVARNIARIAALGGRQTVRDTRAALAAATVREATRATARTGRRPAIIPAGGSSPQGMLGFVNAGLELAEQILAAQLPRPSRIYVPFGSAGTTAGLAIGLALAGMPVPIQPVAVVPPSVSDARTLRRAAARTLEFMRRHDRGVPEVVPRWLPIDAGHIGAAYGDATPASQAAVRLLRELEGLALEPSYGGKAMASMLEQVGGRARESGGGPLLFWHTYDAGAGLDDVPADRGFVPAALQRYASPSSSGASARVASTASP